MKFDVSEYYYQIREAVGNMSKRTVQLGMLEGSDDGCELGDSDGCEEGCSLGDSEG